MRVAAVAAVIGGLLSGGCAPLLYGPPLGGRPMRIESRQPSPVGRWYAVMELRPGSVIGLVAADGTRHTGRLASAGMDWVRLHEQGVEIEIARDEVARVDLLRGIAGEIRKHVVRGAAAGAVALGGTEMFFGTMLGGSLWIPSARTWGTGAAGGALVGLVHGLVVNGERTVYIAPRIAGRCCA